MKRLLIPIPRKKMLYDYESFIDFYSSNSTRFVSRFFGLLPQEQSYQFQIEEFENKKIFQNYKDRKTRIDLQLNLVNENRVS